MYTDAMNDHKPPRPRRVTITQIAAALGVTPATVSNAFNRPDQLSPELREKVLKTAAHMGYAGPNAAARSLQRGRAGAFGVLYNDRLSYAFADPAFVQFLAGVSTATEEADLGLLLLPGSIRTARNPAVVRDAVVDGFVIYSMYEEDPLVRAAFDRRLPVVVADGPHRAAIPFVGIDDEAAAKVAAAHLVALGHRHFGVIALEEDTSRRRISTNLTRQPTAAYYVSRNRLRGYTTALEAAGIVPERVPMEVSAENVEDEGYAAAVRLLGSAPRPTALLAMSDRLAIGAMAAARDRLLTIPRDLSVVGFDDIPAAAHADPPLTTIWQPHAIKGAVVGKRLVALLRGDDDVQGMVLSTRLVVRGSTGPAPTTT